MSVTDVSGLSQLGTKVDTPESPEKAVLEKVPNGNAGTDYVVRFTAPEFTSLCPMTGQPDFAHIVIDYIPGDFLVESKSLKLFLQSFRNHGAFHEDCSVYIAKRLVELLQPKWLRIGAYWHRAAAFRSMCSGRPDRRLKACGCRIRALPPIAAAADPAVYVIQGSGERTVVA